MKKVYLRLVLLASLVVGACSCERDDDGIVSVSTVNEPPVWEVNWNNDQERPNWQQPDASAYENWTIIMVQIEEALQPYVSDGDLMGLFVNDELRGLASLAVAKGNAPTDAARFVMKAYGNEAGSETVSMSLRYYCQKLRHMFTLSGEISLSSDETTGTDEDYIPPFTTGSEKYPLTKTVAVETILTALGITPAAGVIAAFVGNECRGVADVPASGSAQLTIHGRTAAESFTLKYYDATAQKMYTLPDAVKM